MEPVPSDKRRITGEWQKERREKIRAEGNAAFHRHRHRCNPTADCTDPHQILHSKRTATEIALRHFAVMAQRAHKRAVQAGVAPPTAGSFLKECGWGKWLDSSTEKGRDPFSWDELSSRIPPQSIAMPDAGDLYLLFCDNRVGKLKHVLPVMIVCYRKRRAGSGLDVKVFERNLDYALKKIRQQEEGPQKTKQPTSGTDGDVTHKIRAQFVMSTNSPVSSTASSDSPSTGAKTYETRLVKAVGAVIKFDSGQVHHYAPPSFKAGKFAYEARTSADQEIASIHDVDLGTRVV